MTNKNSTKRTLLASVLSLALCFAMLVGSTFAWFTDSATTGVNKIVSGNLDVELEYTTDFTNWNTVKDVTLFDENTLWEPGHTETVYLRIRNAGSLALDYTFRVSATKETPGTNIKGEEFLLSNALDFAVSISDTAPAAALNRDEARDLTNTAPYSLNTESAEKTLVSNGIEYVTLVVYMPENVGNDYNYDGTGEAPTIDLGIFVEATQAVEESDSYGNTYDENADGSPDHPEFAYVNNGAELTDVLKEADANTVIVMNTGNYEIAESIKTDGTFEIQEGADVTLNLNGNSITTNASSNNDEVKVNEPTVLNKGNLTIDGGTIKNMNATAGNTNVAAVRNVDGTMTLKNCKIENISPNSGGDYAVVVEGGKVILENCTVKGNRGAISVSDKGSIEMIGGSVTANVYYPLYIRGTGDSTFTNVTFTKMNNSKGKAITYNVFEEGAGSATFTGCTFTTERSSEISFDISGKTTGVTFYNCTFTKVKNPNV